jgi:hypothetical protein
VRRRPRRGLSETAPRRVLQKLTNRAEENQEVTEREDVTEESTTEAYEMTTKAVKTQNATGARMWPRK